jgi:hypothetical protein
MVWQSQREILMHCPILCEKIISIDFPAAADVIARLIYPPLPQRRGFSFF